ncbi:hypothetical protein SAMN02982985_05889 [Rugamonas rubra]|uniref:Uncharacterized protein n=1 Tax=Rugamonas rubra TaxID=758825 RepID=A0A1I4V0R8_9BURK|nr:hypothetical protein SAMN02982985_05889 [Rugamonas rubra]
MTFATKNKIKSQLQLLCHFNKRVRMTFNKWRFRSQHPSRRIQFIKYRLGNQFLIFKKPGQQFRLAYNILSDLIIYNFHCLDCQNKASDFLLKILLNKF